MEEWKRCKINEKLKIHLDVGTPIIPALGRLRQDVSKFEVRMGYMVKSKPALAK